MLMVATVLARRDQGQSQTAKCRHASASRTSEDKDRTELPQCSLASLKVSDGSNRQLARGTDG